MKPIRLVYLLTLVIVALMAGLLTFSAFPFPGNYKILVVLSGSMEPKIGLGSLVLVRPQPNYSVGEVVTFKNAQDPAKTTTHRIVERNTVGGEIAYVTKGDANNAPDSQPAAAQDIVGKVLFSLPLLGYAVVAVKKPVGFFLLILLPATMIIYDELRKIKDEVKKMRAKTAVIALFFFSLSFVSVSGMTSAFFSDTETSSGNLFQVTSWDTWIQTNQADFEAGVLANIDTSTATDSARLTGAYAKDGNAVALWHMNEGSGPTISDSSDGGNNGTINGASWTSGKYAGALDFDGSDDYVEVPDKDNLTPTNEITLEAWIYPRNLSGEHMIISKYNHTTNDRSYNMRLVGDKLRFELSSDGTWQDYQLDSNTSLSLNTWIHVAAVSNGTTMKLYINGNEDSNTHSAPSSLYNNTENLRIGLYLPSDRRTFDGIIDEVRISNTARSSFPVSYFPSGTLESQPFDGGGVREWDNLAWDETIVPNTDITLEVATSADNSTWSAWLSGSNTSPINLTGLTPTRYFKWRATLTTTDSNQTPILSEVRVKHFSQ